MKLFVSGRQSDLFPSRKKTSVDWFEFMENKTTILVVDDEPAIRMGLAAAIGRRGYRVITAENGSEGIRKAKENLPDLIVSDVMMPAIDGFEMHKQMSADPQLASIPFIFLTARTGVEDRISGIRDGADDYIAKPFVPMNCLRALKRSCAASMPNRSAAANRSNLLHWRK